jgi:hypothetical protein
MDLGWKVFLPALMGYIMLTAVAVYLLDAAGVTPGVPFSAALFAFNLLLMVIFIFLLDRGRLIRGAAARSRRARRTVTATSGSEGD